MDDTEDVPSLSQLAGPVEDVPSSSQSAGPVEDVPSLTQLAGQEVVKYGSLETIVSVLSFGSLSPALLNALAKPFVDFLAGESVSQLRELLGASGTVGMSASTETIFMPHDDQEPVTVTITLQQKEYPVHGLALEKVLINADVQTLRNLKGVDDSWKVVARRVLCTQLYADRVPETPVREIPIEHFLTQDGLNIVHVEEALAQLEGLERMVTREFVVDVPRLRELRISSEESQTDILAPVRQCISLQSSTPPGSSPPGSLLLAVCAAGYHITGVPSGAFFEDNTLLSIVIPTGITEIGLRAFKGCANLREVILPTTVTSIASCSFQDCRALPVIDLPASLTSIDTHAFRWCSSLETVVFNPYAIIPSIEEGCFAGCMRLQNINLPTSVTSIGARAFDRCHLTKITLPASVTSIGEMSFSNVRLTTIHLPASLTSIGSAAFQYDYALSSVDFSPTAIITSIPSACFGDCHALQEIDLPASITSIHDRAFSHCLRLAIINLPESLAIIRDRAFQHCVQLTTIKLPASLEVIGEGAFQRCQQLQTIEINGSALSRIGDRAFAHCRALTTIDLPESLTHIGEAAFENCQSLTTIAIPASVTEIAPFAFQDCKSLTSVVFPVTVKSFMYIGRHAFIGCTSLKRVALPAKARIDEDNNRSVPIFRTRPPLLDRIKAVIQTLVKWILEFFTPFGRSERVVSSGRFIEGTFSI